jgi:hypothetical protein
MFLILSAWLFVFLSLNLQSQPQLIAPGTNYDPYPVTFTDVGQRIIVVHFNEPVNITSTAGWTITVAGVSQPITISGGAGTSRIGFEIPAGIITNANKLQVRISYNQATGNVTSVGSGLPLGSITNYTAVNNFQWDCTNAFTGNRNIGAAFSKTCAATQYAMTVTWEIHKRVRYSIYFNRIDARVDFGDGSAWSSHTMTGTENPFTGDWSFNVITPIHTYPIIDVCAFFPRTWPIFIRQNIPGHVHCSATSTQTYSIASHQLDNEFSGILRLFPEIGHPDNEYCVGEDIEGHIFRDLTTFNCNIEIEENHPNINERWVQFVYGTSVNLGPEGMIPNVWLDTTGDNLPDTQVTDENGNLMPGMPYVGQLINYDQVPLPGANGTGYPNAQTLRIFHDGDFDNDVAGMRFEVTMRQWGPCNPWTEFGYMSNVIVDRSYIELIASPPQPLVTDPLFCFGGVEPTITATGSSGTYHWYNYADTEMTTPIWASGTNAPFPHGQTGPGEFKYWVRAIQLPSPPGCVGQEREVTMTILPPVENNIVLADQNLCLGDPTVPLTGSVPTGGDEAADVPYFYEWERNTSGTWAVIAGAVGKDYNPGPLTQTTQFRRIVYSGEKVIWIAGIPDTILLCSHVSAPVTITVNPLASITTQPVNSSICAGTGTSFTIVTGATPAVTARQWQVSTNNGVTWNDLANGGVYSGVTTATLNLAAVPGSYNGYQYRCILTTAGPCPRESNAALLTVHPLPIDRTVVADPAFVCHNTGTNIILNASENGTVYQLRTGVTNIGATQTGNGANRSFPTGNLTATTTFNIWASKTTTIGTSTRTCNLGMTNTPQVVVNPAITLPAITHADVCIDGTIDLPPANPSGGSGNFSYSWTTVSGTPHTSSLQDPAPFSPTVTGAHSYNVLVTDAGFSTTSGGVAVCTMLRNVGFAVNPLPVNKTIAPNAALICYNTSTLINIPASQAGVRYFVYRSDNTPVGDVLGDGGLVSVGTGLLTANTSFYAVAVNVTTNCSRTLNTITVNVNPRFELAQLHQSQNICINFAADIRVNMTGGVGPFTVNYSANGFAQAARTNYVSGTLFSTGVLTVDTEFVITSVTDANGCPVESTGTSITISVGSNPVSATLTGSGDDCEGTPSSLSVTINGGAPPYTVVIAGHGTVSNYVSGTEIGLGVLGIGAHDFTVTSVTDLCGNTVPGGGLPGTYRINIEKIPSAAGTLNNLPVICNDGTTSIELASDVTETNFAWTVASSPAVSWVAGKDPVAGSRTNGNGWTLARQLAHTGTVPVTVTYTITPTGPGATACPGVAITRQVVVNPAGQVNKPADQVVCNNTAAAAVTFSTNRTGGTTTYAWTNSQASIGLAASGTGNIASFTALNTGTAPVTATITVTPTFSNGGVSCTGPAETFTITVNPSAQVNKPADQVVCNDGTTNAVTFSTNRTVGTTTYSWVNNTPSIGLAAGGSGNIGAFTALNGGTAPVTATITITPTFANGGVNCTGPAETFTITVNPTAQVNKPANMVVCNDAATPAVNFTTINTVGTTTYSWTNDNPAIGLAASGSGSIGSFIPTNGGTAPVSATITVTPTFTNGGVNCTGPAETFTITVNPSAQVNKPADQTVCHNSSTVAVTFSTNRTGGTTTYAWTNDQPGIGLAAGGSGNIGAFAAVNNGTAPVTATITIIPTYANGGVNCTGPAETFTITVNPTAQVNKPADQVVCNDAAASVIFTTDRTVGTTTYSWTNDTPSIGLAASGSGNIASFTALNGGSAPLTATVTVTPTFAYGGVNCTGPAEIFTITVNPSAQVNKPADQVVCNDGPTVAVSFATNRAGGTTTYEWTNSLPSIGLPASGSGNIASFTALNTGTAPVTATITVTPVFANGGASCTGPAETFTITVNPTAQVNKPVDQVVCNNSATAFVAFSTNRTVGTTTYTWTNNTPGIGLPANGSGNLGSFTATNGGTAPVTATITVTPSFANGGVNCTGPQETFTITVNPTAQVDKPADLVVCNNAEVTAVIFSTTRTGGITTYSWTNSNPGIGLAASGTGDIGAFTALNGGTSPVTAIISVTPTFANGGVNCTGPVETFSIMVNPTAQVNATAAQTVCNDGATTAVTFSTTRTGGATSYAWTNDQPSIGLAAGGTGNIGSFTAINTGTAPVTATITVTPTFTNGGTPCTGPPESFTITVNPSAQVNKPADQVVCNSAATAAVTLTTNNTPGTTTYAWINDTPGIGLPASGTGNIGSFTATNGGTAPLTATITVTPAYAWGGVNCTGPVETFTITVNPTAQVNKPANQVVCNDAGTVAVGFTTANTVGTTTYTWTNNTPSIGLAASGSGNIGSFTAVNNGTAPVTATLTVTPTFEFVGESCTGPQETFTITVNPTAQVNKPANQVVCNSAATTAVSFATVNTLGTTTYAWTNDTPSIGLAAGGSGNIGSFTAVNSGTDPVTATITVTPTFANSGVNCTGPQETFTITVNPTPVLSTTLAPDAVCSNSPFIYTPASATAGTAFEWSRAPVAGIEPASASAGINGINEVLRNLTGLPVNVTYIYTLTANACSNIQQVVVAVNPEPVISTSRSRFAPGR